MTWYISTHNETGIDSPALEAHTWFAARARGARLLGCHPDECATHTMPDDWSPELEQVNPANHVTRTGGLFHPSQPREPQQKAFISLGAKGLSIEFDNETGDAE